MKFLLNYLVLKVKIRCQTMLDHGNDRSLVLDLQLSEVVLNGPIMKLEQIFRKSLVFSDVLI